MAGVSSGLAKLTGLTEWEIGNIMKEREEREKAQRRAAQMQWVMNKSNFNPATIGGFMLGGILGDSINRWLNRSGGDPRNKLANVNTSNMTPEQKLDWNNYKAGGDPFVGLFGNLDALEKKKTQEEMKNIEQAFSPDKWNLQNAIPQNQNVTEFWRRENFF